MPNTALQVDRAEWSQKVEHALYAVGIIGRKLVVGRTACQNPGSEHILIKLEVLFLLHYPYYWMHFFFFFEVNDFR